MQRRLRIMFQGGGARVVILLAAAEALQEIEIENGISIVEVAGVSAGSIAAAALASAESTKAFRQRFVAASREFVAHQRKGISKLRRRPSLSVGTTFLMLADLVTGRPFLSRSALYRLLRRSFLETPKNKLTLGNTRLPLTVFVSDLRDGRSVPLNGINNKHERVVDAVLRSVSLPFVFSTYETGYETDGGVCGNLPVSYFGHENNEDAQILAIHFPEETNEFGDAIGYARALLTSAMNASVREAVEQTSKFGGVSCEIPTKDIGTFDFISALDLGANEPLFQLLVAELKPILLRHIDELFGAPRITKISAKNYERHATKRILDGLRRDFPYRLVLSVQAQIHGDVRPALPSVGKQTDKLLTLATIEPASDTSLGLKVVNLGLPFGAISLPLLNIRAVDKDRCSVGHTAELLAFPRGERIENQALLFFDEIVPPDRCPVSVRIAFDFEPALARLRQSGVDSSSSNSRIDGDCQRLWLIATPDHLPLQFTDLMATDQSDLPETLLPHLDKMRAAWTPGSQLDDKLATTYFSRCFDEPLQDGTRIAGWQVERFPKGYYCGFTVRKRN